MALDDSISASWPPAPWTPAQSRGQLAAIAWLRWRIFVHSFRYRGKKRNAVQLAVIILARIIVWAIIAAFCVGPIAACGIGGYYAVAHRQYLGLLSTLTWAVFGTSLFISIVGTQNAHDGSADTTTAVLPPPRELSWLS